MQFEFELNSQTQGSEKMEQARNESAKEDRKDQRVDRQAKHQKEMIEQRKQGGSLKNFESTGNDILTGGADNKGFAPNI